MNDPGPSWFDLAEPDNVPSPSLLVCPDRVRSNIQGMIRTVSGPERLRPHVKTHKMPAIMELLREAGLNRFKAATLAEAEMCARAGAEDVLLAYPAVGPAVAGLLDLARLHPATRFAVTVDDPAMLSRLEEQARRAGRSLAVFLDLDCGQHRTGMAPGPAAFRLYEQLVRATHLDAGGLHIYDGHLHEPDPEVRRQLWEKAMAPCREFLGQLRRAGLSVPTIVAGGTPTFPFHAQQEEVECSPGTCVLWDAGYGQKLKDLDFQPAAVLFTRVISKPGPGLLCLDLGHKAVASENPHPRVIFPDLPDARAVQHSEEHLVVESSEAGRFQIGQGLAGIPWHICPTVALHDLAFPIHHHRAGAPWPITARRRRWSFESD